MMIVVLCASVGAAKKAGELLNGTTDFETKFLLPSALASEDRITAISGDRLLITALNDAEASDRNIRSVWEYYVNEIRWKRKAGEAVLLLEEDVTKSRLPYSLKTCPYFTFEEKERLLEYLSSPLNLSEQDAPTSQAVAPPARFNYIAGKIETPKTPSSDFSVRARKDTESDEACIKPRETHPSHPANARPASYTGTVRKKPDAQPSKPLFKQDAQRDVFGNEYGRPAGYDGKKLKNPKGVRTCGIAVIVIFALIISAIFFFVVFGIVGSLMSVSGITQITPTVSLIPVPLTSAAHFSILC